MISGSPIWRLVTLTEEHRNPGFKKSWAVGGSRWLTLDCGHVKRIKLSTAVPKRARCPRCESLRDGTIHTEHGKHGTTVERWDAERATPIRETSGTSSTTPEDIMPSSKRTLGPACPRCKDTGTQRERNFGKEIKDGRWWCPSCGHLWFPDTAPAGSPFPAEMLSAVEGAANLANISARATDFFKAHMALNRAREDVNTAAESVGKYDSSLAIDLISMDVRLRELQEKLIQAQKARRL